TLDARILLVAAALAIVSGLLFGFAPVRQVLRANPYEVVKAGSTATAGRRGSLRDVLLVLQVATCAVLVTSSMVAVRGMLRSLHGGLGFEPRNTVLLGANLATAGYRGDGVHPMQRRMIEAMRTIPGVERVGLVNSYPPLAYAAASRANVFKDETSDPSPSNVAAMPFRYEVSPEYFEAAGTSVLTGRTLTWHDDKDAPAVAVVNRELAARMFGSITSAVGRYFRVQDGTRVQVVGVVEDGKYLSLGEDAQPAMFFSFLGSPS